MVIISKDVLSHVYSNSGITEPPNFKDMSAEARKYWILEVLKNRLVYVRHGDVLHWLERGEHNPFFWHKDDGVIPSCTEIDERGSVPPCFRVGEGFLPDHWVDDINYNQIVFLSDDLISKIKQSIVQVRKGRWVCSLTINNELYAVEIANRDDIRIDFDYYNRCLHQV